MRPVVPIFNKSNIGGPFYPVIDGTSLRMSYDSFLFTDGTDMLSAIKLEMEPTPSIKVTKELKVYLKIVFSNGSFVSAGIIGGYSWWTDYPKTVEYSDDSKKIDKQISLYAPIFSAFKGKAVYGQYVNTDDGEITVYRHVNSNLMLMQTCKYYFLLPAPFAPTLDSIGLDTIDSESNLVVTV
jgi:hypothetical protein